MEAKQQRNRAELGMIIRNFRKKNKIGLRAFAKMIDVSPSYLTFLERNENPSTGKPISPSLDTIRSAACAMNMDLITLMSKLGMEFDTMPAVEEGIVMPPMLSNLNLDAWVHIPLTQENLDSALAEGRVLLTPFRLPRIGMLVYIPDASYNMNITYEIIEVQGGIYAAKSEIGTIRFTLFDIDRRIFISRDKATAALHAMREKAKQCIHEN